MLTQPLSTMNCRSLLLKDKSLRHSKDRITNCTSSSPKKLMRGMINFFSYSPLSSRYRIIDITSEIASLLTKFSLSIKAFCKTLNIPSLSSASFTPSRSLSDINLLIMTAAEYLVKEGTSSPPPKHYKRSSYRFSI